MAKRDKNELKSAADGNAIGLTQAFAPIDEEGFVRRGRHARIDDVDDWSPDDRAWDAYEAGESFDFDDVDEDDAAETTAIVPVKKRGKHAKHAAVVDAVDQDGFVDESIDDVVFDAEPVSGKKSKKSNKSDEDVPEYLRKSRRTRKVLLGVVALLVVLALAVVAGVVQIVKIGQEASVQQTQSVEQEASSITGSEATDAATVTAKKTNVPNLVSIMGMTQEQAIEQLGSGAQVTATSELNEEGNPIKTEVRVALTEEPADSRTGTPTVYLGLNSDGKIIQAGYSTSTTSLGYGSLSFADAVQNEHIIEKTLVEAGVEVAEGTVSLPEDKTAYSTYDTDGTTLTKEYCSFKGEAEVNGSTEEWSAVLSYDYAVANATGNLADTVRTVYVYIG